MTKSILGRKGFTPSYRSQVTLKEVRSELRQKVWRKAAYWFPPNGSLSLLSHAAEDHLPRVGIPLPQWGVPTMSIIYKENAPRLHHRP